MVSRFSKLLTTFYYIAQVHRGALNPYIGVHNKNLKSLENVVLIMDQRM